MRHDVLELANTRLKKADLNLLQLKTMGQNIKAIPTIFSAFPQSNRHTNTKIWRCKQNVEVRPPLTLEGIPLFKSVA